MPKYEILIIPNYLNDEIIIKEVKRLGISTSGITRKSGFVGCDVPVILDIECNESKAKELKSSLEGIASDTFSIYERCPCCGKVEPL